MEEIITPVAPTAEQVHYSGFWRRFAAYVIDGTVLNVALLPFSFLFLKNSGFWDLIQVYHNTPPAVADAIGQGGMFDILFLQNVFKEIMYFALWQGLFILLYYAFWESSKLQATPGKLAVRIQVSTSSGERISFLRALFRNLSKIISGIIFYIGFMMAGWTSKKQALHDMMTDCIVTTPEPASDPTVRLEYAGFWRRFVAWVLDKVLLYIILSPINYIFLPAYYKNFTQTILKSMRTGEKPELPSINDLIIISCITLFSSLLVYFYFASWEASRHQATPGKLALGIKVTDIHGQRLSFWRASGRYIDKYVTNLTLLIGYMMAGWTDHKQALHDKLSNCLVVSSSTPQVPHQPQV